MTYRASSLPVWLAGQGLGGQLLVAAALRCLRLVGEGGGILLTIDAKSERAATRYASFGAESLQEKPLTLVMSLATFAPDLRAKGLLQREARFCTPQRLLAPVACFPILCNAETQKG